MLRKLFLFSLLFPLCFPAQTFPAFDNVVYRFYMAYHGNDNPDAYLSFARKKDGWHVIEISVHDPSKIVTDGIFWSRSDSSWKNPGYPKGASPNSFDEIGRFTKPVSRYNYSRLPYYGYPGWDEDIIRDFGTSSLLNDTLIESRSRAYSSRAYDWVAHPYDYTTHPGKNTAKDECIRQFIEHIEKAIALDQQLMKQWPGYQTLTGNAVTRFGNDVMGMYEQLSYYGKEAEAEKYFSQTLYDGAMRAHARNLLELCDQQAVLFVSGDNDFYPLRYLQVVQKIRTDVTVINTGLLQFPEKIVQLQQDTNLRSFLPAAAYADSSYLVIVGAPDLHDSVPVADWFHILRQDSSVRNISVLHGKLRFAPASVAVLNTSDLLVSKAGLFSAYDVSSFRPKYAVPGETFWSRSRIAAIDIAMSNLPYRPVYYAASADPYDCWFGMQYNDEGMLLRLMPVNAAPEMNAATARLLAPRYLKKISTDTIYSDTVNALAYATELRRTFSSLAQGLISAGQNDQAEKAADYIRKILPVNRFPLEPAMAPLAAVYYDAGKAVKGDALSLLLLDDFEKKLERINDQYDRSSATQRNQMLDAIDLMARKARSKQRTAVTTKAAELLKKYGS